MGNLKCLAAQALRVRLRPLLEALVISRIRIRKSFTAKLFPLSVILMIDAHFIYDHDYDVLQIFLN